MNTSVETVNAEETYSLGVRIGRLLGPGDVVALEGPLGSGKTCLSQGICHGLDTGLPCVYIPYEMNLE